MNIEFWYLRLKIISIKTQTATGELRLMYQHQYHLLQRKNEQYRQSVFVFCLFLLFQKYIYYQRKNPTGHYNLLCGQLRFDLGKKFPWYFRYWCFRQIINVSGWYCVDKAFQVLLKHLYQYSCYATDILTELFQANQGNANIQLLFKYVFLYLQKYQYFVYLHLQKQYSNDFNLCTKQ